MLEKLINQLSKKQKEIYEIVSVCNKEGKILVKFDVEQIFKTDCDYNVSLLKFEASAFFPNIKASDDDGILYYSHIDAIVKELKFPEGAYDIKDINKYIQYFIPDKIIEIEMNGSTGNTVIRLKPNTKVYLDKNNCLNKVLGFNNKIISDGINFSDNVVNILGSQKISLCCDKIIGSYLNEKRSNILYSFSNSFIYGQSIIIRNSDKESHLLRDKSFQRIEFSFVDDDNKPIDFNGNAVSMTILISQV